MNFFIIFMSLILGLETSSQNCSVALFDDAKILVSKKNNEIYKHSQILFTMIQNVLKEADVEVKKLDAIAISSGPGSFTGLRIGSAAALGMCHALEIPLIAINTLESLISTVKNNYHEDILFCPMIDARRMEVYCMISDNQNNVVLQQQAKIIDEDSFKEFDKKILCFGDGATKCKKVLQNNNKIQFLDGIDTEADNLCKIAYVRFQKKIFDNILTFSPNYIK